MSHGRNMTLICLIMIDYLACTELYSIQSSAVAEACGREAIYTPSWERVEPEWCPIYKLMSDEMRARSIAIGKNPPVWAWAEPKDKIQQLAEELLSKHDWQQDISVLHLCVPKAQALLSSYFEWNELLDSFLETGDLIRTERLFALDNIDEDDHIQASLPYIRASWIVEIYPLHSKRYS